MRDSKSDVVAMWTLNLRRHQRRALPVLRRALPVFAAAVAFATATSCGGSTGEFYILHNQIAGDGCTIPANADAPYRGEGVLDVRVSSRDPEAAYLLFPLLQNDLPDDSEGGVSANRIALSGFEVDLAIADASASVRTLFESIQDAGKSDPSSAALVSYQVPWSGSLDPAGGHTSAITDGFPAATARRLRDAGVLTDGSIARFNVNVRAIGHTLSGRIRSDVFTYPLRVCDGCLIRRIGVCPLPAPILTGGQCNPGQDSEVDCCTQSGVLMCPASISSSTP